MTTTERISVSLFLGGIALVYLLEFSLIVVFVLGLLTAKINPAVCWSKPALAVHCLAAAGAICFIWGRFIEPYWIEVKTIPFHTGKLTKTRFRLIHISDLHCDSKPRNEKKLIKLINREKADIIVFTGDTLNLNTPRALPLFKETMKNLNANLGKFAVRGNVDAWYLPDLDLFSGTGFDVLDKKTVKLQKNGETLCISGLSCEYPHAFADLLKNVPKNFFSIFLYHYADLVENLENLNVDLYLSGHTHAGQVRLPIFGALTTLSKFGKKYEAGMYTVGNTVLYINRGIGTEGGLAPRVRFLARPEITVIDIEPDK